MIALLMATDAVDYVAHPLFDARVLKVGHHGMLLTGTEMVSTKRKRDDKQYRQSWWCEPVIQTTRLHITSELDKQP